jgi:hypothetical protein
MSSIEIMTLAKRASSLPAAMRVAVSGLAAIGAMALAGGGAAAAATIVLRANGPSAASYPPGKTLSEGGSVMLKAGDTVTVLDAHGTRVLRGNGRVAVSGTAASSVNGIAALIADTGLRQTRTGATRGTSVPPHPSNVWFVDASRSGPFCVVDTKAMTLWRPHADADATLTITRLGDGKKVPLVFRAGQAARGWPLAELPAAADARFSIAGAGPAPAVITMKLLPMVPAALDDTATALLSQGCSSQVDLLVTATMADASR